MKMYNSAPLPYRGQKRCFAKEFAQIVNKFPNDIVFIDLFGGTGLLSHVAKRVKPTATVIYNDYSHYTDRIRNIPMTNSILERLREMLKDVQYMTKIQMSLHDRILSFLQEQEQNFGYIDCLTISTWLLFSGNYCDTIDELKKQTFYNNAPISNYKEPTNYLNGITITHGDFREIAVKYKDVQNAVFILDPPYYNTDCSGYTGSWSFFDSLDLIRLMQDLNQFIFFTSPRSQNIEIAAWLGKNIPLFKDVFAQCLIIEKHKNLNSKQVVERMLYTQPSALPLNMQRRAS